MITPWFLKPHTVYYLMFRIIIVEVSFVDSVVDVFGVRL